jgi:hypothetical protein
MGSDSIPGRVFVNLNSNHYYNANFTRRLAAPTEQKLSFADGLPEIEKPATVPTIERVEA